MGRPPLRLVGKPSRGYRGEVFLGASSTMAAILPIVLFVLAIVVINLVEFHRVD